MSMPVVSRALKKLTRRAVVFVGLSFLIGGIITTSLDQVFSWSYNIWFARIGLTIYGLGFGMILIAALPEIIDVIESSVGHRKIDE